MILLLSKYVIIIQEWVCFALSLLYTIIHAGAVPLMSATFGMGSGMIVEHVRCNGTERQLSECTIRDSTDGQCSHSQDAGVRCCKLIMN